MGYDNVANRKGFNFYVPQFTGTGVNTVDINSIVLNDGAKPGEGNVGFGDIMQIVGPGGNSTASYLFYEKGFDETQTVTTDFYWGDDNGVPVKVSFGQGDGVNITNPEAYDYTIQNAGQVIAGEGGKVSLSARKGFNYTGNPFAAPININAIVLNDGAKPGEGNVGFGDIMQIVGPGGNSTASYLFYEKGFDETETVTTDFYWGDDNGVPVNVTLNPGDGINVTNPEGYTYDIEIACPYSL